MGYGTSDQSGLGTTGPRGNLLRSIGAGLLVAAFGLLFIVPEILHYGKAHRFVTHRLADIHSFISNDMVKVPGEGLPWKWELEGRLFRGVQLGTEWPATTRVAGPGRCEVSLQISSLPMQGDWVGDLSEAAFSYLPLHPARLRSEGQVRSLLRDLGVKEPLELIGDREEWLARWGPVDQHNAEYNLQVRASGEVKLVRRWRWGGWD